MSTVRRSQRSNAASIAPILAPDRRQPTARLRLSAQLVTDILLTLEAVAIAGAAFVAEQLVGLILVSYELRAEPYLLVGLMGGLLATTVMRVLGLADVKSAMRGAAEWRVLLLGLGLAFLCLVGAAYALKVSANYSRIWLGTWLALSALSLLGWRALMRRALVGLVSAGYIERRVVVIAPEGPDPLLACAIAAEPGMRLAHVVAIAPEHLPSGIGAAFPAGSPLADLAEASRREELDEIVVDASRFCGEGLGRLLGELKTLPNEVWLNLCPPGLTLSIHEADRVGPFNLLKVRRRPIEGWGYVFKQVLDYAVSAIALLALLPLLALITLAIKLDSPGPVLFRQRRIGYNDKEILIFKFRTMTVVEDGPVVQQAQRGDERITRVGRLLRATSLDELPQLLNVLKGEMSLVGPRPHAIAHHEFYRERVQDYSARHRVKPGITGLSQINGLRGLTETPEKMQRRVEKDLEYTERWSIWLDVKILALTPIYGLMNPNAF